MRNKLTLSLLAAGLISSPAFAAFDCDAWTIHGNNMLPEIQIPAGSQSPAEAVKAAYDDAGIALVRIAPAPELCAVRVYELKSRPTGPFAAYLPYDQVLTTAQLRTAGMRIGQVAALRNQVANVSLGAIDAQAGTVEVITSAADADPDASKGAGVKTSGMSLTVGNSGSRYTSEHVPTAAGFVNLPEIGARIEGSISTGIPGSGKDSKGGGYQAGTVRFVKPTELGEFSADVTTTDYKVGGEHRDLEISGGNTRTSVGLSRQLTPELTAEAKAGYVSSNTKIGAIESSAKTTYATGYVGLRYVSTGELLDVAATAGVLQVAGAKVENSGSVPLAGEMKSSSTALRADSNATLKLPSELSSVFARAIRFSGSAQSASKYLPEGENFYIGGPDRGSASANGQFAGPSGVAGSVRVMAEQLEVIDEIKMTPFYGINGGQVKPVIGDAKKTAAAEVGLAFTGAGPDAGSLALSVSKPLTHEAGEKGVRVGFTFTKSF